MALPRCAWLRVGIRVLSSPPMDTLHNRYCLCLLITGRVLFPINSYMEALPQALGMLPCLEIGSLKVLKMSHWALIQ